jgi:hypothetical protein
MAAYRIVFYDDNGEPIAESAMDQPDDTAALDQAAGHVRSHGMHIWEGDRLVARVPPEHRRPSSYRRA